MKDFITRNIVVLLMGVFILFSGSTRMTPSTQVTKMIMATVGTETYTIECDEMPIVNVHLTLDGDVTLKVNGLSMETILNLMIHQDATGGHTLTLDLAQFATVGGIQPSFSEVALECNTMIFMGSGSTNEVHLMAAPALGVKHGS